MAIPISLDDSQAPDAGAVNSAMAAQQPPPIQANPLVSQPPGMGDSSLMGKDYKPPERPLASVPGASMTAASPPPPPASPPQPAMPPVPAGPGGSGKPDLSAPGGVDEITRAHLPVVDAMAKLATQDSMDAKATAPEQLKAIARQSGMADQQADYYAHNISQFQEEGQRLIQQTHQYIADNHSIWESAPGVSKPLWQNILQGIGTVLTLGISSKVQQGQIDQQLDRDARNLVQQSGLVEHLEQAGYGPAQLQAGVDTATKLLIKNATELLSKGHASQTVQDNAALKIAQSNEGLAQARGAAFNASADQMVKRQTANTAAYQAQTGRMDAETLRMKALQKEGGNPEALIRAPDKYTTDPTTGKSVVDKGDFVRAQAGGRADFEQARQISAASNMLNQHLTRLAPFVSGWTADMSPADNASALVEANGIKGALHELSLSKDPSVRTTATALDAQVEELASRTTTPGAKARIIAGLQKLADDVSRGALEGVGAQ